MRVTVNYAGFFGEDLDSGELIVEFPGASEVSIADIADQVNDACGTLVLHVGKLVEGRIRVLHEGTPIAAQQWEEKRVRDGDQVSAIVPLIGG